MENEDIDDLFADEPVAQSPQASSSGGRSHVIHDTLDAPPSSSSALPTSSAALDSLLRGDEESDEEVEFTAEQVLSQFKTAWTNERFAPDLLECKTELLHCILHQMQSINQKLERLASSSGEGSLTSMQHLNMEMHQMEVHRLRYLVSSYLRLRLRKIEKFVFHYVKEHKERPLNSYSKFSPEELQFAVNLERLYKEKLSSQVLKNLPSGLNHWEEDTMIRSPNLDHFVFVYVNETKRGVLVDEYDSREGVVDLEEGFQYLLRFKPIASLVESGALSLI